MLGKKEYGVYGGFYGNFAPILDFRNVDFNQSTKRSQKR